MRNFGLIGFPLTHSFSKKYFEEKFERERVLEAGYELYPIASVTEFLPLVKSMPNLVGLNVTIPYKETVMDYLDEIDREALQVDAVNCIKVVNGKLKGYNTDVFGFENTLRPFICRNEFYNNEMKVYELPNITAFVLGTGGSAKAVKHVLRRADISFLSVSREGSEDVITYSEIEEHLGDYNLFMNTTPLGMYPEVDCCPDIPYERLTQRDFLYDLTYNPTETLFLKKGRERGANTQNGLEMLKLQAEKSWEIWNS
jgi:shikimate dehydrogenase